MSIPSETAAVSAVIQQYAQLLSLAAHEFRTPASVVSGYLRMLQKDDTAPLPDRQRHMIDEAAKSCARLIALVSELSDIGKLDGNTAPVSSQAFDLFADLDEVAAVAREGADREVTLQLGGSAAGATMTGDRVRLTAAFGAFFRAILREQPAAATVAADRRLLRADGNASAVVVIAKDTDVQRAYDAARRPLDEKRGGVGLSLPIARRVIERHGGQVWSPVPDSDHDTGLRSAIVVSLPLPE
jgi:signal transduction histidine kinase